MRTETTGLAGWLNEQIQLLSEMISSILCFCRRISFSPLRIKRYHLILKAKCRDKSITIKTQSNVLLNIAVTRLRIHEFLICDIF